MAVKKLHVSPELVKNLDPSSLAILKEQFIQWKSFDETGQLSSYLFGRDGAYSSPKLNTVEQLRHVHMSPLDDAAATAKWDLQYAHK